MERVSLSLKAPKDYPLRNRELRKGHFSAQKQGIGEFFGRLGKKLKYFQKTLKFLENLPI